MPSAVRQHTPCEGVRLCRACAAAYLGISIDTFDDHARASLPRVRIGARVGFLRDDLDAWARGRREAPSVGQQSPRSATEAASGTTASPSRDAGFMARRANEIDSELTLALPRGGTKRTGRRAKSLRLV